MKWTVCFRECPSLWVMGHTKSVSYEIQPTSDQECAKKGLRRYKNVRRQQDPWCHRGALVQWCVVVKLMRCSSKQLVVMFSNPLWCSIPLKNKKFENKVLFPLGTRIWLPDQQLPIFALNHSSDWLEKKRCLAPPKCDWDPEWCSP
jgi:hypothetical protein